MKKSQQYLEIGTKTYKIQQIARKLYDVYLCMDICSLKYIGQWTGKQLKQCWEREVLV